MRLERWVEEALCRDVPTNLFYPDVGSGAGKTAKDRAEAKAKVICAACPVRVECLSYAVEANEKNGVWGGMGERERAKFRSEVRRRRVSEGQR